MSELSLKRRVAGLVLVARGERDALLQALGRVAAIADVSTETQGRTHCLRCTWHDNTDDDGAATATEAAVAALVGAGGFVREVKPIRSTLEELFAELTAFVPTKEDRGS